MFAVPPYIERVAMRDMRVKAGSPFRFDVKVSGEPEPEILWYKDGERVTESDIIEVNDTSAT